MFLPVTSQGVQSSHFCWISFPIFDHQSGFAAYVNLFITGVLLKVTWWRGFYGILEWLSWRHKTLPRFSLIDSLCTVYILPEFVPVFFVPSRPRFLIVCHHLLSPLRSFSKCWRFSFGLSHHLLQISLLVFLDVTCLPRFEVPDCGGSQILFEVKCRYVRLVIWIGRCGFFAVVILFFSWCIFTGPEIVHVVLDSCVSYCLYHFEQFCSPAFFLQWFSTSSFNFFPNESDNLLM